MEILTPAQKRLLETVATIEPIRSGFALTGGTALAAFFLHHRLSEDLDLFTQVPHAVPLAVQALQAELPSHAFAVRLIRDFPTFAGSRYPGMARRSKWTLPKIRHSDLRP